MDPLHIPSPYKTNHHVKKTRSMVLWHFAILIVFDNALIRDHPHFGWIDIEMLYDLNEVNTYLHIRSNNSNLEFEP